MSWIAVATGGVAAGSAIYKAYQGNKQIEKGEAMRSDLERRRAAGEFTYKTPDQVYENLNLAKNQFLNTRLPGQSVAENKIQGNTAQAVEMSRTMGRSPAEIIAGITGANANENAAFNDLSTAAAERQRQDLAAYQDALNLTANYKDKEFAYNKWLPYQDDRGYAENLIGAGNQNFYGGMNELGTAAIGTGMNLADREFDFGSLFKSGSGDVVRKSYVDPESVVIQPKKIKKI